VAVFEGGCDLGQLAERTNFETTRNPADTLVAVRDWLLARGPFDGIGVASFGPVDAKVASTTYGYITTTPKDGWRNTDVIGLLGLREGGVFFGTPFNFDTDVNAPALAEYSLHRVPGSTSSCYITVGTGVGVGLVVNGATVKGLVHPEGGHLQVARRTADDFAGSCPFHGHCIEGMCSTGALSQRRGIAAAELPGVPDDDELWDTCAYYLAQLCANLVLTVSPEHIAIGGGVLNRSCLYPKIRKQVISILNEYVQHEALTEAHIDEFITPSIWGASAGIVGAAYLAKTAHEGRLP
jgi:fructokinase